MPLIAEQTVNSQEYWQDLYERGKYPTRDGINVVRYQAAAACQAGAAALDIGCGQGGLGLALFAAFPEARYTGWDYAQWALHTHVIPLDLAANARFEWRDWRAASGTERWDTVYLLEILEHELEPERLVQAAASWARKRVVVTVPRRGILSPEEHRCEHHWDFDPDEIGALFEDYGSVTGPSEANYICDLYVVDLYEGGGEEG